MDLKKDYREFYKHWLKEINNKEITNFNEDEYLKFADLLNSMKDLDHPEKTSIKSQLIEGYKSNISFMLKDYLSIRKLKIINSAMMMEEIDLDKLIESEKLLYQNLVSAFKGFQKMSSQLDLRKPTKLEHSPRSEVSSFPKSDQGNHIDPSVEIVSDVPPSITGELDTPKEEMEYKYSLLRILKETPELVGYDMKVYGPFQKEDIVNLPEENAVILVTEKFAERFEIS